MIETILGLFGGGGIGGILRLGGELVTMFAKRQEFAQERERDADEHDREMKRADFEMKHAAAMRESRREEAEALERTRAGAAVAEADAKAEMASLDFGNAALWAKSALAARDWTGAMNRLLLAIVNFVNGMVRGTVTYYFVGGYGYVKFLMVEAVLALGMTGFDKVDALLRVITPFDTTLLGTIIGFWFMDRSLRKRIKEQGGAGR